MCLNCCATTNIELLGQKFSATFAGFTLALKHTELIIWSVILWRGIILLRLKIREEMHATSYIKVSLYNFF